MHVIHWASVSGSMYYREDAGVGGWVIGREKATRYAGMAEADKIADRLAVNHRGAIDVLPPVSERDIAALSIDVFGDGAPLLTENQYLAIKCIIDERDEYRAALLPFAAAAGRPGRLVDGMNDKPLPDDAALGLGVKVAAWKKAIELTGANAAKPYGGGPPVDPPGKERFKNVVA